MLSDPDMVKLWMFLGGLSEISVLNLVLPKTMRYLILLRLCEGPANTTIEVIFWNRMILREHALVYPKPMCYDMWHGESFHFKHTFAVCNVDSWDTYYIQAYCYRIIGKCYFTTEFLSYRSRKFYWS